jgi:uncharacterized protein with PIN domain
MNAPERKFLCDEMLGALARWLRIIGYDAAYAKGGGDAEILAMAVCDGRVLLTRDEQLAERSGGRAVLIRSCDLDEQLAQLRDELGVRYHSDSPRCPLCGNILAIETREEASGHVPENSLRSCGGFFRCLGCGHRYWEGSHWKGIMDRLGRLGLRD